MEKHAGLIIDGHNAYALFRVAAGVFTGHDMYCDRCLSVIDVKGNLLRLGQFIQMPVKVIR